MKKNSIGQPKEIFASCDFSSLGLHPALCDQLRGMSKHIFIRTHHMRPFQFPSTITMERVRITIVPLGKKDESCNLYSLFPTIGSILYDAFQFTSIVT